MIVSLVLLRRLSRGNYAGGNDLEERDGDFGRGSSDAEEGRIAAACERAVSRRQHPVGRTAERDSKCHQIRTVGASSLRRLQHSVDETHPGEWRFARGTESPDDLKLIRLDRNSLLPPFAFVKIFLFFFTK